MSTISHIISCPENIDIKKKTVIDDPGEIDTLDWDNISVNFLSILLMKAFIKIEPKDLFRLRRYYNGRSQGSAVISIRKLPDNFIKKDFYDAK